MSLYTFLNTPIPTIAYSALHQVRPGIPRDEYQATMNELHERIAEESRDINATYSKHLAETLSRESQTLQNALSHFLQTPISSDNEEVQRMLVESFERFKSQIHTDIPVGLQRSLESKVFLVSSKHTLEKKLLRSGKAYLGEIGFTTTKGHEDIFESTFIMQGAMNLDVLEHIIRDRLGIYSTTHGKHLGEFKGYAYGVYNLAFAQGEIPSGDIMEKHTELTFYFSKPDVKYGPFREGLSEALEKLTTSLGLKYVSLWQRKLGLGGGKEFVLRIISDKPDASREVVEWLNGYDEKTFVGESIVGGGHLLIKELLLAKGN